MNIFSNLLFIDHAISLNIVYFRNDFFDQFFLLLTWLGSWQVITVIFICLSILFYSTKKRVLIFPLFVSILGSGIMAVIIKYLVNRGRPGVDIALYLEKLPSFPSAHAALSLALFGFLIFSFWRFNFKLWLKISFSVILTLLIATIGFSRLYLGVHYLSDVIAGYLVGLLWLLIAMYLSRKK